MGRSRQRRATAFSDPDRSRVLRSRAVRVSAERFFELARYLTERDRAIALGLYEPAAHRRPADAAVLQLQTQSTGSAPFSQRRARARPLLSTASVRAGKPQAHGCWTRPERSSPPPHSAWSARGWAGSAATTGRRTPQLLRRLEANRFVTDLIASDDLRSSPVAPVRASSVPRPA